MRRFVFATFAALSLAVGVLVAPPASASSACSGGSSCDETVITYNNQAQFILNVENCISTTNHDVDSIRVFNNSSDHARHAYVVQVRREQPTNIALIEATIFVDYGASLTWEANIASVPKSQKLYAYVRDGNGFVQRLSVYHLEGGNPWTKGSHLVYPYNTYDCI
jgi:hypothetical protein